MTHIQILDSFLYREHQAEELYLDVNPVHGISHILEDRFEGHEEISTLHSILLTEGKFGSQKELNAK